MKIGIIGKGFVGSAVEFGFSAQTGCDAEVRIYDKDKTKSIHTLDETINKSDFIFLSVPTPSNEDGTIHLNIVYSALEDIQKINKREDNIILVRSTVTPGTTRKLQESFPKLNIIVGSIGGRLLLFGNVDENNQPHELSLHQGLPPHEGEKWVMTLWFRETKIR